MSDRSAFVWPGAARAAVSLTYDDATPTQRQNAAPALARHGLFGTFFATGTSPDLAAHRNAWVQMREAGHELASHTMYHPCDCKHDWVPRGYTVQDYDLPRMQAELHDTHALLAELGAKPPYTFAYPCGETQIGKEPVSYVPLVRRLFFAARGVTPKLCDPWQEPLELVPAHDGAKSAAELVALVEQAVQHNAWLVLIFHGVGGDHIAVAEEAHAHLLAHLSRRRSEVWTERFGVVAAHVAAERARAAQAL
jgi:peptidoglycan/xylan/chitin deacetylase (PgdA/CDA1 family)